MIKRAHITHEKSLVNAKTMTVIQAATASAVKAARTASLTHAVPDTLRGKTCMTVAVYVFLSAVNNASAVSAVGIVLSVL